MVNVPKKLAELGDLASNLFLSAQNVRVVLDKAAHAHHAVKRSARLVPDVVAKFGKAKRKVFIRALAAFEKAAEELTDAEYEPIALLAESGGVYCILCRVTKNGTDAEVSYALVYAGENGVQNIWDLWIAEHSMPR